MHFVEGRIWPAMFTPLDESGALNLEAVDRLVELFAGQQLGGLFVAGSTGQGVLLSPEERRQVSERAVRAAAGRIPIMVHVGSTRTEEAISLARHAAEIGADAVSSVPPIYYPLDAKTAFAHYHQIGAATDLPFFPYHASFLHQALPAAKDYAGRLLEIPNIAGMKFTDRDLYLMEVVHAHCGGRLKILSGADELLCQAALSGAVGAIGTFYNLWGPACQRVRQALVAGDFERGRRFMITFARVIDEILSAGSMWSFHRASMRLKYDIDVGPPRAPLGLVETEWPPADVERLVSEVDAAAE